MHDPRGLLQLGRTIVGAPPERAGHDSYRADAIRIAPGQVECRQAAQRQSRDRCGGRTGQHPVAALDEGHQFGQHELLVLARAVPIALGVGHSGGSVLTDPVTGRVDRHNYDWRRRTILLRALESGREVEALGILSIVEVEHRVSLRAGAVVSDGQEHLYCPPRL